MTELLTTDQVAERLKVTKKTALKYIHNGELQAAKIGGGWRIKEEDLNEFIEERKASTKRKQAMLD